MKSTGIQRHRKNGNNSRGKNISHRNIAIAIAIAAATTVIQTYSLTHNLLLYSSAYLQQKCVFFCGWKQSWLCICSFLSLSSAFVSISKTLRWKDFLQSNLSATYKDDIGKTTSKFIHVHRPHPPDCDVPGVSCYCFSCSVIVDSPYRGCGFLSLSLSSCYCGLCLLCKQTTDLMHFIPISLLLHSFVSSWNHALLF